MLLFKACTASPISTRLGKLVQGLIHSFGHGVWGYTDWGSIHDHVVDLNNMVDLGSGSQPQIDDIMLTGCACYLIAQNSGPCIAEIAFNQTYLAVHPLNADLIYQRMLDAERSSPASTFVEKMQ